MLRLNFTLSVAVTLLLTANTAFAGGLYLPEIGTPISVGTAGVGTVTNNVIADAAVTNPAGNEHGSSGLSPRRSFGQLNAAFKEIIIAATLYQCGDYQNIGRMILEQYSQDVNGHFASYAQAILSGKGLPN